MKTLVFGFMTLCAAATAPAQLFTPESFQGALLGGLAGAVIGHNTSDRGAEGAAIGAAAGLLFGSLLHESRRRRAETATVYLQPSPPVYIQSPPAVPAAPQPPQVRTAIQVTAPRPSPMASANRLFGR